MNQSQVSNSNDESRLKIQHETLLETLQIVINFKLFLLNEFSQSVLSIASLKWFDMPLAPFKFKTSSLSFLFSFLHSSFVLSILLRSVFLWQKRSNWNVDDEWIKWKIKAVDGYFPSTLSMSSMRVISLNHKNATNYLIAVAVASLSVNSYKR